MEEVTDKEALSYDAAEMLNHIEKCKDNIKIFEDAIQKEHSTIERDKKILSIIEHFKKKND